ncbi:MAG: hypothetical protein ABW153_15195 [Sedimenticola sp.]
MRFFRIVPVISFAALVISAPTWAGTILECPDISKARQLVDCPDEPEVKRMFKSTCGWERDPQAKNPEKCDSYAEFKRRKFNALWESSDGGFMGYVTCAAPAAEVKRYTATGVAISQKNGLYRIACNYQNDVKMIMRTRSVCRVPGVERSSAVVIRKKCGPDPSACKVECD